MKTLKEILRSIVYTVRRYISLLRIPKSHNMSILHRYTTKQTGVAFLVIFLFLGVGLIKGILSRSAVDTTQRQVKSIKVVFAGSLEQPNTLFTTTGIVRAKQQGDLRALIPGIVKRVYVPVGKKITRGTVVAAVENATQRAGVAQALAGVSGAKAQLEKVTNGTRKENLAILKVSTQTAKAALETAKTNAENTLLSAYASTDTAFSGGIDAFFNDAGGANPVLIFQSTNSDAAIKAEYLRFLLQSIIVRQENKSAIVYGVRKSAAITDDLVLTQKDMYKSKAVLDTLISALNGGIATVSVSKTNLVTYTMTATTARVNILRTISALTAAQQSLVVAKNNYTTAQQSESLGITGAQKTDILAAKARVAVAQAAYAVARAQLVKTYISAPVSGTLTSLLVSPGDFVNTFQNVGLVVQNGVLEIQVFIAPKDAALLTIGGTAQIKNTYSGTVVSIAPGIDSIQKQKEIRVQVGTTTSNLLSGEQVAVTFLKDKDVSASTTITKKPILVPLSALKLLGSKIYIFVVTKENSIKLQQVTLGAIQKNTVQIYSNTISNSNIVLDARGLTEGESVTIIK